MKYCTFYFKVKFWNGSLMKEKSPYIGEDLEKESLIKFIKLNYIGRKKVDFIQIKDIKEFRDDKSWLTIVKDWESFRLLYKSKGFAKDLLHKYLPGETIN